MSKTPSPVPGAGSGKRMSQVSAKFEAEVYERLKRACEIQQHRDGQLVRILVEWSLPFYEEARSVEALQKMEAVRKRTKKKRDKNVQTQG